jgi:dihydroorotase
VDEDAKQLPFGESEVGATGLELLLSLALKWAAEMKLPLSAAIQCASARPSAILGLDAGHLAVGAAADICVFDAKAHVRITAEHLRSQGKNTPYLGYELPGRVRHTLVSGRVVFGG